MPATKNVFYKDSNEVVPLLFWLDNLKPVAAADKCMVVINQLAKLGYELRRPYTDTLRDGIRELRTRLGSVNYRILYFFQDRNVVVLTHGLTKEGVVPDSDINRAIVMKQAYQKNPEAHGYFANLSTEGRIYEKSKPIITNDGIAILEHRYLKNNPVRKKRVEKYMKQFEIGQQIYDLRQKAGLTQAELADMIGTTHSVISRLEDADYDGHSLKMLQRIATSLGKSLTVRIEDVPKAVLRKRAAG